MLTGQNNQKQKIVNQNTLFSASEQRIFSLSAFMRLLGNCSTTRCFPCLLEFVILKLSNTTSFKF